MTIIRDFGPVYWHMLIYPVKPPVFWEKAVAQETDDLYRGGVGISFRLPFTRLALVIGRWTHHGASESQALTNAIAGRPLAREELNWDYVRFGAPKDPETLL